jgi:hypothetical protein
MTAKAESKKYEKIWIKFLRNHWHIVVAFIAGIILAVTGAVLVFLWFVAEAQATGLVPLTLNLWAISHIVTFLLHLIFWEILLIGIPVIIAVVATWQLWWKKIPDKEREEYRKGRLFGKRSKTTDGGGGISLLINIVFVIKIYLDGNWEKPFADWTFDYLVYSYLWAIFWILIIFGIPIAIGATLWIRHEMKKES